MSILTTSETGPTKEQLLERKKTIIQNLTKQVFENLLRVQKNGITLLWKDPNLTPQEIIDSFGQDAIKLFMFHGGLTDFINTVASLDGTTVELATPTNAFVVDKNGNITVTTDPYVAN